MAQRIGFLGLGQMGKPMALNLCKAGFKVLTSVHRRREPLAELVSAGAEELASAQEVAREADLVILCLPDPPAVQNLVFSGGLLQGLGTGKLVIDMGTTGLPVTRACAEAVAQKGAAWMDAPISGGVWGAQAGSLTIMVGCEAQELERALPVFQAMGKQIVHVGPLGAGQVTKLINNLMACINTAAVSEAFALGVKAGVDVKALYEVISHSSGNNWVLENAAPRTIFAGNYQPGGRLKTMTKDLNLVSEIARELQAPLLLGSIVLQLHNLMLAKGHGEEEAGVLARFYEEILGVSLASRAFQVQE